MRSKFFRVAIGLALIGAFFLQGCQRGSDLVKFNEATKQAVFETISAQMKSVGVTVVVPPTEEATATNTPGKPTEPPTQPPSSARSSTPSPAPTPSSTPVPIPPTQKATAAATASPPGSHKPSAVVIWHSYPPQMENVLNKAVDAYMKDHPESRIQVVKQPDIQEAISNLTDATGYPDIIAFTSNNVGSLAESGTIIPLNQLIHKLGLPFKNEFEPLALKSVSYQGFVWAVPHSLGGLAWVRNTDLAKTVPTNIDDFLKQRAEFEKEHPGDIYFLYPGRDNPYFNAPWFYGEGGFYITDNYKVGIDTPGGIKGMQLVRKIAMSIPKRQISVPPEELFSTGKLAWIMTEGQILDQMKEVVPIDLPRWPVLEDGKRAKPLVTAWCFGIYSGSAFQPQAVRVADDLAVKYIPEAMKGQVGFAPASIKFNNSLVSKEPSSLLAKRIIQIRDGAPFPNTPAMDILWNPLANMWQAVLSGAPIEDAAKQTQKLIEDSIKAVWGAGSQ